MTEAERLAKIEAYGLHFLERFRSRAQALEVALDEARRQLSIAEREYADGHMVTGNEDGIPTIMRILNGKRP